MNFFPQSPGTPNNPPIEEEFGRFVNGEPCMVRKYQELSGIIRFTLPPTDGITGPVWITRLERKDITIGDNARKMLLSKKFVPTTGVVREIAVLKGESFTGENRITRNILAEGTRLGFQHGKESNPEIACQIREMFTNKEVNEMGLLWIITMHEPVIVGDDPRLLVVDCDGGDPWLYAYCGKPGRRWDREGGFALVVPQVGT